MANSAVIDLNEKNPKVTFAGLWTRRDIDTAYRLMFRELPKHLSAKRRELEQQTEKKEKSDGSGK